MDGSAFTAWAARELGLDGARLGPRLSGGNSNVTQKVIHAGGTLVLRRPPDNAISPSAANGVRREHRMLRALRGHAAVPAPLGFCDDPTVIGQPFLIQEHIDGVSITTNLPVAYAHEASTLRALGGELVDAIAAVHALDHRALGLEASPDAEAYLERQITRWLTVRARESVREQPLIDEVGRWLMAKRPATRSVGVVHGDCHLDNALFLRDRPVLAAIIDWELSTIGDPLTDLGLMLAFWGPRAIESPGFEFVQGVTRAGIAAPGREALAHRWSLRTGIPVDALDYYLVFALWRLAAIVEGAWILFARGLTGDDYARRLEHDVPALLAEAAAIAGLRRADARVP